MEAFLSVFLCTVPVALGVMVAVSVWAVCILVFVVGLDWLRKKFF